MAENLLRPSAVALILANLVPLAGVLLFDWQVFDILMLYWAENVVIGLVNVLRMSVCQTGAKWFLIPFFLGHYGFFCFGHLAAVTGIFSESMGASTAWSYFFGLPLADAWKSPLWVAIAAIAASHLFSFFGNFLAGGEYRRTTVRELMHRPYGRIIVLHVTIIVGAALVEWLGSPLMMLVVLVAAKIALDLRLHLSERDKFAAGRDAS
ncbi:MAG: DUF6498-containing protein [Gammaproteobacteria bacterium]|nr:DUF6498-containing protein [Gammaproteobacteria bacterium]